MGMSESQRLAGSEIGAISDRRPEGGLVFDNSYARLPDRFYSRLSPTAVAEPRLIKVNHQLADLLGIDAGWLASPEGVSMLAGNRVPAGADPIATAYAGHQFGAFVPQLGDGRAILIGEVVGRDGVRRDLQLKGAGRTPYSRRGDGRAALGPVLREYIVSEAMAALGIPTTRALAAVATGEPVIRDFVLPGAVLTRVAQSHIRVGTFQYFAVRGDNDGLRTLADHVISRHYPEAGGMPNPYRALLDGIVARQARLVAMWMHIGFIHGVMNTDNCSIAGETIDYGPCAFMDTYNPGTVFSSIDHGGRYAYANQPRLAQWNLGRLAEAMLPLLGSNEDEAIAEAQGAVDGFSPIFEEAYWGGWTRKIGLPEAGEEDQKLVMGLFSVMAAGRADFTATFRCLADAIDGGGPGELALLALFGEASGIEGWLESWRTRLASGKSDRGSLRATMRVRNPAFIPRNHRVEEAIAVAVSNEDFGPFERLVAVLSRPFEDQPEHAELMAPPEPHEVVRATFCGT